MKTEIYILNVADVSFNDHHNLLMRPLSPNERQKIEQYRRDSDKLLSLYSILFVRNYVSFKFGIPADKIEFTANEYGKPSICNLVNFHFNISHTKNVIAVAVSKESIGIDVERINKSNLKVSDRFFTADEKCYITQSSNPDRAFCEIWTKKEAYIKWLGTGLSTPLNSFNVLSDELRPLIKTYYHEDYVISISSTEKDEMNLCFFDTTAAF